MNQEWPILSEEAPKPLLLEEIASETLRRNVSDVLDTLAKNCYKSFAPARLIAVTKSVGPAVIEKLKPLNILDIAENRSQVAIPKLPKIAPEFRLHWIGRLQTNKVKYIIDHVCMVHTLDRLPLAQEIDRRAGMRGITIPTLVQVNIAREPQKAGMDVTEVKSFLQKMKNCPNLRVKGLMAMMPLDAEEERLAGWFCGMRALFDQLREDAMDGIEMEELSMGMSNDYAIAAREGATMVRVGTALYRE